MKSDTAKLLLQLTSDFYNTVAGSFDQTRQSEWAGWKNLAQYFADTNISVLDVGCGNGRFAQFLSAQIQSDYSYTGIDSNLQLLQKAREKLAADPKVKLQTLVATDFLQNIVMQLPLGPQLLFDKKFTHICIFGLLHHIPGIENTINFITELSPHLTPEGYVLLSLWQPLNHPERFVSKKLSAIDFGIPVDELTDNDLLLGWQSRRDIARYCHSFTSSEVAHILESLPADLKFVTSYHADGKSQNLNTYIVLQKQSTAT